MPRASTNEEIQKLIALGLTPGETISWAAIEEVLAPLTRQDRRFKTIYRAFIRHAMKWYRRDVEVRPGQGLYVLHEHERATATVHSIGRVHPILKRGRDRADSIQIAQLDGLHLDEANHVRRVAHFFYDTACAELHKLANRPRMPEPTPAPPRRSGYGPGDRGYVSHAS